MTQQSNSTNDADSMPDTDVCREPTMIEPVSVDSFEFDSVDECDEQSDADSGPGLDAWRRPQTSDGDVDSDSSCDGDSDNSCDSDNNSSSVDDEHRFGLVPANEGVEQIGYVGSDTASGTQQDDSTEHTDDSPTLRVAVPSNGSQGACVHAPNAPCSAHRTTNTRMTLTELAESDLDACTMCQQYHGLLTNEDKDLE